MAVYEIKTVISAELIQELADNLRDADREEMRALGHTNTMEIITESVAASGKAWAGLVDGKLALIAGIAPHPEYADIGIPWMLGTDLLVANAMHFMRNNRIYMRQMLQGFAHLVNVVDARNTVSIAWLTKLGFTINKAAPFGPYNKLFHVFEMRV